MPPRIELALAPAMLQLMTELHKRELVEYNEWKQGDDFRQMLEDELWRATYGRREPDP